MHIAINKQAKLNRSRGTYASKFNYLLQMKLAFCNNSITYAKHIKHIRQHFVKLKSIAK